jgi:parallel beta-helix repeat protein
MKLYARFKWLLVSPLLLVTFSVLAGPPQAVTECETLITEPGKYRLVNDLVDCEETGVAIVASDVTLDLKKHTISCADNGVRSGGIVVGLFNFVRNVKVTNGAVTGCADGILIAGAEDSKITKMTSWNNRLWDGPGSGTGITVWFSHNNVIMNNDVYGNPEQGIGSWESSGNLYKHNTVTDNFLGIWSGGEDNAQILCNQTMGNVIGIGLGPGSNGSLIRGNRVSDNLFDGISLAGRAYGGILEEDIPAGNTVRMNIAENNGSGDLFEGYWNFGGGDFYLLHPDGTCLNTWEMNQYGTSLAPANCIKASVLLDEDDVCALDEDD